MKISYFLRDGVVHCRINDRGKNVRVSTKIKLPDGAEWNQEREDFTGPNTNGALVNLLKEKVKITDLCDKLPDMVSVRDSYQGFLPPRHDAIYEMDIIARMRDYIALCASGDVTKKKGSKRLAENTIRSRRQAVDILSEFAAVRGSLNLEEMNVANNRPIQEKKAVKKEWDAWWKEFIDYCIEDRGLSPLSTCNTINNLGTCLQYISSDMFLGFPKLPSVETTEGPIIILPLERVPEFLNDTEGMHGQSPRLSFFWEIGAVMLVSAMRRSDAAALRFEHMTVQNGLLSLRKKNQKTGAWTVLPLTKLLSERLLANYKATGNIYTDPGHERLNATRYIRELMMKYEWCKQEITVSSFLANGQEEFESGPLWEFCTPHIFRRTAITNMLKNGVSREHVAFASGHSINSKAIQRYIAFLDANFNSEIGDYHSRVLESR